MGRLIQIVGAVLLALVLIGLVASGALARLATGTVVADRTSVAVQQAATERDLERGYEQATDHVRQARALKLAITAQQADAIANKAFTDLFTLRHSALVAIAQTLGGADAAEAYAATMEKTLDAKRGQPQPSTAPVLLAPRLYTIVARFNDLATQIADQATTDLTQSTPSTPAPSPTPSPRPSVTPTPSPTR
jgi:type II secretory pathway pseudopilin PulG